MDISNFRNVSTGLFELDREITHDSKAGAVTKGSSRLASRVRGWANSVIGNTPQPDQQKIQGRIEVKQAFLTTLTRSEGGSECPARPKQSRSAQRLGKQLQTTYLPTSQHTT